MRRLVHFRAAVHDCFVERALCGRNSAQPSVDRVFIVLRGERGGRMYVTCCAEEVGSCRTVAFSCLRDRTRKLLPIIQPLDAALDPLAGAEEETRAIADRLLGTFL